MPPRLPRPPSSCVLVVASAVGYPTSTSREGLALVAAVKRKKRSAWTLPVFGIAVHPYSSASRSPPSPPGRRRRAPGGSPASRPAPSSAAAAAARARTSRPPPPAFAPVPTASPFVWAAPGMDPALVLPPGSVRGKARAIFTSPAVYLDPGSLNYALPPVASPRHTEVAFLGRSNVGKSSLIGALLKDAGGKGLVRTSKTPGCTQTLNLYRLAHGTDPFLLVDLPGYGFAKAPAKERDRWMDVSLSYLETRGLDVLKRTLLLVDARHGLKPQDERVMAAFDARAVPYQLVLTKADALRSEVARREAVSKALAVACGRGHVACWPVVHLTSAKTGEGLAELREALAGLMFPEEIAEEEAEEGD